jgi:hypothetical protein
MQSLREMLARGGIAIPAIVFALAFAAFGLANEIARVAVFVLQQQVLDPERGGALAVSIAGTQIDYTEVLQAVAAIALIVGALAAMWLLVRRELRTCPECQSDIPASASVCRYCTTELSPPA